MRISIDGELKKGVTSKDIILYIISKIATASGGTGYFIEYAGSAIEQSFNGGSNDHLQYEH